MTDEPSNPFAQKPLVPKAVLAKAAELRPAEVENLVLAHYPRQLVL